MKATLGKRFFLYTGVTLIIVLLLAFAALERNQSRQWEEFLHSQSLSFARFSTPEILKHFRGSFSPSDESKLTYVYDFLGFNRDLIRFSIYSPSGRLLFESPQFPDYIDMILPEKFLSGLDQRLNIPRATVRTEYVDDGRRVLDLIIPAFGPTGEQMLSVRYLVSFDSVDRRLAEMRAQFLRIGAFALIAATFLAAVVARRISRPLSELAEGARAIGKGAFATRTTINRSDEIGGLARAFNEMAENISLNREELTEKNLALRAANEELKQVQSQLIRSESLAAIGQLAAGVSHEIDNPIGIILGYAELLMDDIGDDAERRDDLQAIIDECHRCRRITGGLLGFARSHSESLEPVDFVSLIVSTVDSLRPQKLFRFIEFQLNGLAPQIAVAVTGDSDRLRQVLVNLLLNAAQSIQGRGIISLSLQLQPGRVSLLITDSGPGVDESLREKIFEPFFSTKASGEGTGLGLSLCRRLVEDHKGTLSLEPSTEMGACFKLILPSVEEKTL